MLRDLINRILWTLACWVLVPAAAGVTFGVIVICGMLLVASPFIGYWLAKLALQMLGVV